MLLSLGLTAAGFYFERAKENLKYYGQAITAGGLAAGYYTLYAAHFVESLYCITSPVMVGALLTAWAAIMLTYACWKQSRIISIMATGLAFYGTIVNPAGWLSLFSALLLSACGMFLLVRYKWNNVGIVTLCAAYISHAFWLGYYPHQLDPVVRISYLASYWILFACATSRFAGASIKTSTARTIMTINNSACWVLAVFIIPGFTARPELGNISLILGGFFILCGILSQRDLLWSQKLSKLYLFKGLFLITLGILVEATGYYRFLTLAMEAIMLMFAASRLRHPGLKVISLLVYSLSIICIFFSDSTSTEAYLALTLLSVFYAGLTRWSLRESKLNQALAAMLPAVASWFILYFGVLQNFETTLALSLTVVIATSVWVLFLSLKKSIFLHDLALVSSVLPLLCGGILTIYYSGDYPVLSHTLPAIGLGMWWSSRHIGQSAEVSFDYRPQKTWSDLEDLMGWAYAVFTSFVLYQLVNGSPNSESLWLYFGGAIAILGHTIAVFTKRSSIAIISQVFHIVAIFSIGAEDSFASLLPFLYLIGHMALSEIYWKAQKIPRNILAPLAAVAFCRWTSHPEVLLPLLALLFHGIAFLRKDNILVITGTLTTLLFATLAGITESSTPQEMIDYLPMVALLYAVALPSWADKNYTKFWSSLRNAYKYLTLLLLFAYASSHTLDYYDGNGLAICWALLASAIFSLGLFLQHRSYRLTGLLWLAASLIHIITIDVMQLNTLGRILSFITIGLILMALGYLYNRFQKRIQKLL